MRNDPHSSAAEQLDGTAKCAEPRLPRYQQLLDESLRPGQR